MIFAINSPSAGSWTVESPCFYLFSQYNIEDCKSQLRLCRMVYSNRKLTWYDCLQVHACRKLWELTRRCDSWGQSWNPMVSVRTTTLFPTSQSVKELVTLTLSTTSVSRFFLLENWGWKRDWRQPRTRTRIKINSISWGWIIYRSQTCKGEKNLQGTMEFLSKASWIPQCRDKSSHVDSVEYATLTNILK